MNNNQYKEIGYNQVTSLTYPNTFVIIKSSNFSKEQVYNRDSASWKKAQVIEVLEAVDYYASTSIISTWKKLQWKDQYLVMHDEAGSYSLYNYKGDILVTGNQETILDYLKTHRSTLGNQDIQHQTDKSKFDFGSNIITEIGDDKKKFLRAMRTKPFLLLAGISGTGKSRIVKEFAFKSCPSGRGLDSDPTSPGNYCLVEVKPNWHDSTELLGYESHIGGSHYNVKPFVKFLAKALLYPDVPFFVCLDEMNLAPVEQYFAEFLSVLESRKNKEGVITSEKLISADIFSKYEQTLYRDLYDIDDDDTKGNDNVTSDQSSRYGLQYKAYQKLKSEGLRIPSNLIVIGTVNMDETTHQFSRKVIDRAMTIEMDIEDGQAPFQSFFDDYEELQYPSVPISGHKFISRHVSAMDAMAGMSTDINVFIKTNLPSLLAEINKALSGTPFKIAYRVQNELILYLAALLEDSSDTTDLEKLLFVALDDIMIMKLLPRIDGDEELLDKPLESLRQFADKKYMVQSAAKIKEMQSRLNMGHYTSFWP